jgi:serine/threonine protein kinase
MEPDESTRSFRCAPNNPKKKKLSDVVEDDLGSEQGKDDVICALEPDRLDNKVSILINTSKNSTLGKGTYGIVRTGSTLLNGLADKNESAFKTFLGKDGIFFSQTVLREIIPLCSLPHHENVLKPRIVFVDEKNRLHFSSKRMRCNLHERLKSASSSLQQKMEWSFQLIHAVNHMHVNGFLHRDIKLENVFLDEGDNVVLGDLGMSRFESKFVSPQFSSGVCTLWTRAPELCAYAVEGRKNSRELSYDSSVDCWSLGVTILSIFAARYFFQGKDEEDMLKLIFTSLGKPSEETTSDSWGIGRETRTSKSRWKLIAQPTSLLSENTEDVLDSLLLECSKRRIIMHPDLLRSILPLLALEPKLRGSTKDVLLNPFWKTVESEKIKHTQDKTPQQKDHVFFGLKIKKQREGDREAGKCKEKNVPVLIPKENVLFLCSKYFELESEQGIDRRGESSCSPRPKIENDIYESCTTRGVLRLAITEWILSLQKSLSLLPLTIIDSILFWEHVRDLVDVEVKNEMVLAAACCSLVSKIHEYTLYTSQRWIRCLSNSASVEELVKYEMLALKTSNCCIFTSYLNHPMYLLDKAVLDVTASHREKILMNLCSLLAKFHTKDVRIDELVSRSLLESH